MALLSQQTVSVVSIRSNAIAQRPMEPVVDVSVNADLVQDAVSDVLSDNNSQASASNYGLSASDITDDSCLKNFTHNTSCLCCFCDRHGSAHGPVEPGKRQHR